MQAAIGIKTHTGWAAVIAVADGVVVAKRRIDLATTFRTGAVFHISQELPLEKAESYIAASRLRFETKARDALAELLDELRKRGCAPATSGIVGGNGRALPSLASILRSHPLVHAAEAELYRSVFARACEDCKLPVAFVPAKDLGARAAKTLNRSAAGIEARLAEMGRASGRPWTADQKQSTLAALIALGR
jgi:hypothetical protein